MKLQLLWAACLTNFSIHPPRNETSTQILNRRSQALKTNQTHFPKITLIINRRHTLSQIWTNPVSNLLRIRSKSHSISNFVVNWQPRIPDSIRPVQKTKIPNTNNWLLWVKPMLNWLTTLVRLAIKIWPSNKRWQKWVIYAWLDRTTQTLNSLECFRKRTGKKRKSSTKYLTKSTQESRRRQKKKHKRWSRQSRSISELQTDRRTKVILSQFRGRHASHSLPNSCQEELLKELECAREETLRNTAMKTWLHLQTSVPPSLLVWWLPKPKFDLLSTTKT